jgi:hypothetical protein
MNQEFIDTKELVELEQFKSFSDKIGLSSVVTPKSETNPVSLLGIKLNGDLNLHLIFVPLPIDKFSQVSLIQFHSLIKEKVNVTDSSLLTLLNRVNEKTPLGLFLLNEDNELVYKYILAKVKPELLSEDFFIELMAIIVPVLEEHVKIFENLFNGKHTLEEALRSL